MRHNPAVHRTLRDKAAQRPANTTSEITMSRDDVTQLKEVEFYSASVTAWYNTQLEHDKNLLTLSAGGIGLLITLLTTVGVSSADGLVLYVLALLSFVTCVGCVLVIFKQNGKYVEVLVKGDVAPNDPELQRLDSVAILSFAAGVVFAVVIGVSAAITSFSNKEKSMSNENKPSSEKTVLGESFNGASNLQSTQGVGIAIESFHGAAALAPQQDLTKSFTGAQNLRPSASVSSGTGGGTQQSTNTQPSSSQQGGNKK